MAIRTAKQFIEALKSDHREVYVNGERVSDVTTYPPFQRTVEVLAKMYDMKHDPKYQDILTYREPETGELADITFQVPKSREDLSRKRKGMYEFARTSYGLMGRSPEFLNVVMMALYDNASWFEQWNPMFAENLRNYYRYVRDHDLFLTHALINPQTDRSKPSHQQKDPYLHLRVKEETSEGLILTGAKMLATFAPLTDELLVYPLPGYVPGDEPYALMFAIPTGTPGLKILCREPLVNDNRRNLFDHPLSARFEEPDALMVFDDVLVPWDRVFLYNNVEAANTLYANSDLRNHAGFQTTVRSLLKGGLAVATAQRLAKSVKTNVFPQVGERLGLMIAMLKACEGLLTLAEVNATVKENGTVLPNFDALQAQRVLFPRFYAEMIEFIQIIGAGGLFLTPTLADFKSDIGDVADRYLQGADTSGTDRVQIAKLAWDLAGEGFGQRLVAYERYYAGDPMFLAAYLAQVADTREWDSMVDEILAEGRKALEVPELAR